MGGRRFRPTLEEFLLFLSDEHLYTDWSRDWKQVVKLSLEEWELLQARSTTRSHPSETAKVLESLGYQITPPE